MIRNWRMGMTAILMPSMRHKAWNKQGSRAIVSGQECELGIKTFVKRGRQISETADVLFFFSLLHSSVGWKERGRTHPYSCLSRRAQKGPVDERETDESQVHPSKGSAVCQKGTWRGSILCETHDYIKDAAALDGCSWMLLDAAASTTSNRCQAMFCS